MYYILIILLHTNYNASTIILHMHNKQNPSHSQCPVHKIKMWKLSFQLNQRIALLTSLASRVKCNATYTW